VATKAGNPPGIPPGGDAPLAPYTAIAILAEPASARSALFGLEAVASLLPSASLRAVHIEVDPRSLIADDEEISVQMLRETREGSSAERAAAVERIFNEWARSSPAAPRVSLQKLVGSEEVLAVQAVQDCDLCIIGRPHNMDGQAALHGILFSHHLLLVMPPDLRGPPTDFCRHIAVGWKPVPQVDQAMLLGLPFLRRAQAVTLVSVDQSAEAFTHDHVLRLLEQMGVEARIRMASSGGRSVTKTLLAEAHAVDADAMFAGAYRHGELFEEIFGGVTLELLRDGDLPLFMAH
jgi:nucleotide-binding universal stress UspA family protein